MLVLQYIANKKFMKVINISTGRHVYCLNVLEILG